MNNLELQQNIVKDEVSDREFSQNVESTPISAEKPISNAEKQRQIQKKNKEKGYFKALLKDHFASLDWKSKFLIEGEFSYLLRPCDYDLKIIIQKLKLDLSLYRWEFNKFLSDINGTFGYVDMSKNNVMCHRQRLLQKEFKRPLFKIVENTDKRRTALDTITTEDVLIFIGYTCYLGALKECLPGNIKSGYIDVELFEDLGKFYIDELIKRLKLS